MKILKMILTPIIIGIVLYLIGSFLSWNINWASVTTVGNRIGFFVIWCILSILGEIFIIIIEDE